MDTKDETLILRIDADTKNMLKELAYKLDTSMSQIVRTLVRNAWMEEATQTKQEA